MKHCHKTARARNSRGTEPAWSPGFRGADAWKVGVMKPGAVKAWSRRHLTYFVAGPCHLRLQ